MAIAVWTVENSGMRPFPFRISTYTKSVFKFHHEIPYNIHGILITIAMWPNEMYVLQDALSIVFSLSSSCNKNASIIMWKLYN